MYLTRSNWLTFNLHYTPNGIETNDQPVLALWYHRSRPAKTWISTGIISNFDFIIQPGAADHPVQATWTTPTRPIEIHRLNPHMHLRQEDEIRSPLSGWGSGDSPVRARLRLQLAGRLRPGGAKGNPREEPDHRDRRVR